jgi:putative oxidoreductase
MLSIFFYYGGFAIFLLRVALALILIAHGWSKIKDLKKTWAGFDAMGFKPGKLFGTLAMLLEFFGGIALLLGFLVAFVTFFVILQFIVIVLWKIAKKMPLVGGWEFDLLILAAAIALHFNGGGSYALDHVCLGICLGTL